MTDRFDLQAHLRRVYSQYPAAKRQPIIGITGNYEDLTCKLGQGYYKSVVAAGGVPIVIPPVADTNTLFNTLDHIDALILSGGGDFNPLYGGEEPSNRLHDINSERDLPELMLTQMAYNRQMPILGICRGIQTLAMALGGRVWQDINEKTVTKHSQQAARSEVTHSVNIEEDSLIYQMYHEQKMFVNSFHHQAVRETGPKFRVTAKSPDNIIEAMESNEFKPIVGVQWHPECLEEGMPLFHWLIQEALAYHHAHEVHNRVLTLDTHCDTPMFFPQGIHFDQRDSRILVDLHKMNEGRQDATIMVAYLPQPKIGETFSSLVDFDVAGPTEYADLIFDKIEEIVNQNKTYLSIARTPGDLYEDKRNHRKSIMLGIENGLALNGSLQNLQHFAQRGIVYMTLCHNGDNDICDSARGCNTHGGVSRFGEQVIHEMNRLGIMVDLSHASEKSFYDALEISSTPIVCSHSSCKALCDHPRNLTDDQMRALASKGGVAQITLYSGFLKEKGEATIIDAIDHLEHAIKIMGIDHVGIGTDFDGDGGVTGLADSSEMINFTRQLMSRRYSERDIQKIWGGNFLRVMSIVQKMMVLIPLIAILFTSCGLRKPASGESDTQTVIGPAFNADSAYLFCQNQCDFGPRTMNSKAHDDCGQWIIDKFKNYGMTVVPQKCELKGYDGTVLHSTNIIASYKPELSERILLCAHWDSRPWADNDPDEANWKKPVMAANDGASGVAVMLEVARLLSSAGTTATADSIPAVAPTRSLSPFTLHSSLGVDFICFDAEDYGFPQWETTMDDPGNTWALGAQYWAENPHVAGYKARYGILLDMVGGQGAQFYQEMMSKHYAKHIVDKVWQAASVVGYGSSFPKSDGSAITDDHIPVNTKANIPCIDIIPYYPNCEQSSFGPTWHTLNDDMAHIEKNTLKAVGQTIIQVLFSEK